MRKLSVYRHNENRDDYYVIIPTNLTATKEDYPDSVTYINIESGNAYNRKLEEFEQKFSFVREMTIEEKHNLAALLINSK